MNSERMIELAWLLKEQACYNLILAGFEQLKLLEQEKVIDYLPASLEEAFIHCTLKQEAVQKQITDKIKCKK